MAKKTAQASVAASVEANVSIDENVVTDALPLTDENTASESHSDDAATNDAPANEPPADDEPAIDDSLVSVAWHDGSAFTFSLAFAGHRIAFIDGVARVPQALADALRAGGYVK